MATNTVIRLPGIPAGLSVDILVKNSDTLALLETVALTESGGYYGGTVTGAHAGALLFEPRISGTVVGSVVRTIEDTAGPFVIDSGVEQNAIRDKTDRIGAVTFLLSGGSVASDGSMIIKAGDRHVFTLTSDTEDVVPDLTGETIRFGIKGNGGAQLLTQDTGITVLVGTGFQSVEVILLPADTLVIPAGAYHFDVQAEYSATDHRTLISGSVTVNSDYSGTA